MRARFGISAAAGLFFAVAIVAPAAAGDYPLAGLTAFAGENALADDAAAIKSEIDAMTGDLAKSGATAADFAKTDACFFGFVKAGSDGTVVTYQLDVDAAEKAITARQWPVPIAYKEVARTACVYDAATNAEACTDPDGTRFALVYFDRGHMEFGVLDDPGKIAATRANPMLLRHDHVIDCSAFTAFLEGHVAPGKIEIRFDVRPLVIGYFVSRLSNDPAFAKAVEASFAAKPPASPAAAARQ
jgi:hypothetical protein